MEITAKDIDVLETKFNQIWRSLWRTKQIKRNRKA